MEDRSPRDAALPRLLYTVRRAPHPTAEPLLSAWVLPGYVCLDGDLCTYSVEIIRERLLDELATTSSPSPELVVDLNWLRFIDSAGVRLLHELAELMVVTGRRLTLHQPGPMVHRVLTITGSPLLQAGHLVDP